MRRLWIQSGSMPPIQLPTIPMANMHAKKTEKAVARRFFADRRGDQRRHDDGPDGEDAAAEERQRGQRQARADDSAQELGGGGGEDRREQRLAHSEALRDQRRGDRAGHAADAHARCSPCPTKSSRKPRSSRKRL